MTGLTQQLNWQHFTGAQARVDIVDPETGQVYVEADGIVTDAQSESLVWMLVRGVWEPGELQDALVPAVAVDERTVECGDCWRRVPRSETKVVNMGNYGSWRICRDCQGR